jgi:hypothetical protein
MPPKSLDIDREKDLSPDNKTAVGQRGVPANSKIVAIDSRCSAEAGSGNRTLIDAVLPVRCRPLPKVVHR